MEPAGGGEFVPLQVVDFDELLQGTVGESNARHGTMAW